LPTPRPARLVGTTSVEKSERVSKLLKKDGVKHNVLNAINTEARPTSSPRLGRQQTQRDHPRPHGGRG